MIAIRNPNPRDLVYISNALPGTAYRYKARNDSASYYYAQAGKIAAEKKYISILTFIQIESFSIFNRKGKSDSAAVAIGRIKEMLPLLDSISSESEKIEMYLGFRATANSAPVMNFARREYLFLPGVSAAYGSGTIWRYLESDYRIWKRGWSR